MATSIDGISTLASHSVRLRALGYRSVEQVLGVARSAPDPLARYLGLNPLDFALLVSSLGQHVPAAWHALAAQASEQRPVHRLGVRLDLMPRRPNVAMAVSAIAAAVLAPKVDLSAQFAYWDCKQHDGYPEEEGTWIAVIMPLLQSDGCPRESVWPYVPSDIPGNESQGPAPVGAIAEAGQFRIPGFRQLAATSVQDIKAELAQGRPVAFSIPVFDSWYKDNPEVTSSGDITNPIPDEERPVGGHAMCMVGYEDDAGDPALGGGRFLIRNSWDSTWGTQSSTGSVGYGTIAYSYIARHGLEAFSVT